MSNLSLCLYSPLLFLMLLLMTRKCYTWCFKFVFFCFLLFANFVRPGVTHTIATTWLVPVSVILTILLSCAVSAVQLLQHFAKTTKTVYNKTNTKMHTITTAPHPNRRILSTLSKVCLVMAIITTALSMYVVLLHNLNYPLVEPLTLPFCLTTIHYHY